MKVTPEVVERIKRLRRLGRRVADIAELCGLSEPTVRKVLIRATTTESATDAQEAGTEIDNTFMTMSRKRSAPEAAVTGARPFWANLPRLTFKVGESSSNGHLVVGLFGDGTLGDNSMAPSNDLQIAVERGMMIAEVNIAIGAIDRLSKMVKDGKSNNRELTNARVELDHWRTRLLKAVHNG